MNKQYLRRTFTIGADPEFALINRAKGTLTQAKTYPFFDKVGEHCKIGRDGNSYPVEIRPEPTYIDRLPHMINDIDNIIKRISVMCGDILTIKCGAMPCGVSIGGHIHFGGRDITKDSQQRFTIARYTRDSAKDTKRADRIEVL